jgi:hypothetical protein
MATYIAPIAKITWNQEYYAYAKAIVGERLQNTHVVSCSGSFVVLGFPVIFILIIILVKPFI